jgi:hypothetical protein
VTSAPAPLTWTAHPAKRRPQQVALVAAVVLITASVVLSTLQSLLLTLLAALFLLISVAPFLLPTHYRLTEELVEERRLLRRRSRRWEELRRLQVGRDAALVSPFARPTWLDRHRGILLLLDGADRAAVVAFLQRKLPPAPAA